MTMKKAGKQREPSRQQTYLRETAQGLSVRKTAERSGRQKFPLLFHCL